MNDDSLRSLPQPKPEETQASLHPKESRRANLAIFIAVLAVVCAGWQGWEAHQARSDAQASSAKQNEDVHQAKLAAKESADTAKQLAEGMKRSAAAAETSATAAAEASRISQRTYNDERAVNKLELEPRISITMPLEFPQSGNERVFELHNLGSVEAVQLSVRFISLVLYPGRVEKRQTSFGTTTGKDCDFVLPVVGAHSQFQFRVKVGCIPQEPATLAKVDLESLKQLVVNQVLYLDLSYLRSSDRRAYIGHALFLLTNNRLTDPDELPDSANKQAALAKVGQFTKQALAGSWQYRPGVDQNFQIDWSGYQNGRPVKRP